MIVYMHTLIFEQFRDPMYGDIELHPLLVAIINTPEFERLRHIKQLGGKCYVYPAASHSRFEHSIGYTIWGYCVIHVSITTYAFIE